MSANVEVFAFKPGDLVLVKWNDSMVYFAKIKKIDQRRKKCVVVFDDKSHDEADFDQIHSVDETTTDIICIKCKRDDSDTPNEIVLCDICGIGYHQKCHIPPIPASALELDTPWNCAYCLRGVKCPYLTESLDVLQNLLSDEEDQSHDDMDSVTTVESDEGGEEFATPVMQHAKFLAPPKPHKKRGRKPKVKRGPKPSAQKGVSDPIISKSSTRKQKEASDENSSLLPPAESISSESALSPSSSHAEPGLLLIRKRSQFAAVAGEKRPRKSSVQSQTLSVTRISVPVHEDSISPKSEIPEEEEEMIHSPTKLTKSDFSSPPPPENMESSNNSALETAAAQLPVLPEKKPRSLRVSLNIPDEVEPGSPLEKVVKFQRLLSPKFTITSLPLWEEDSNVPLGSSGENPLVKSPSSSGSENGNLNQQQPSPVPNQSPSPKNEHPLTPFTASALPLQACAKKSENGERKRKSEDEVDSTIPPPKKVNLNPSSPPESPSDDVFTSPNSSVKNGSTVNRRQTPINDSMTAIVKPQSSETGSHQPSPAEKDAPNVESLDSQENDILSGTAATPVGYGAESTVALKQLEKPLTQATDTPTAVVVTVQTSSEDKVVGKTPRAASPEVTSNTGLITPLPTTEPRLESVLTTEPKLESATPTTKACVKTTVLQSVNPTLLSSTGAPDKPAAPERQAIISPATFPDRQAVISPPQKPPATFPDRQAVISPPLKPPATEQSKLTQQTMPSEREKAATTGTVTASVISPQCTGSTQCNSPSGQTQASHDQSLSLQSKPATIQSSGVIMSSQRPTVPNVSSSVGNSHSSPVSLENGPVKLSSAHTVSGSRMALRTTSVTSTSNSVKDASSSTRIVIDDSSSTQPHLVTAKSALASTVVEVNPPPQTTAAVSVITAPSIPISSPMPVSHLKSRQIPTPKSSDSDIIITNVEIRPQSSMNVTGRTIHSLPSYTEAVHSRITSSANSKMPAVTHTSSPKGRPQSFFAGGKLPGQQTPSGVRVTAKIADPGRSGPQQRSQLQTPNHAQNRQGTSSFVKPTSSQTPVSVVPLLATPTAYTQPMAQDGSAYTIIPTDAVVHGGRHGVAIAMPPGRAMPPGSLPIDTTAVVVQQAPQGAVQYIIEPVVPAVSTSVVCSHTASTPATPIQAVNGSTANALSTSVYRVQSPQVVGSKSMPVTTTKPYAIVSAQPTSIEIQGIAVDQRGTPVISPQVPVGYNMVTGTQYIQATVTPTVDPSVAKQAAYTTEKAHSSPSNHSKPHSKFAGVGNRISQINKNHSHASREKMVRVPGEQTGSNIGEIGRKIEDAFANHNEQMLIAAFEDAWKKFQANGKKYQSTTTVRRTGHPETAASKSVVPPNAEVVSVPGTSSRLSLIRPTYSRSKMSGTKSSPDQLVTVRASDTQPSIQSTPTQHLQKQQQFQYVYYTDGSSQSQVYAVSPDYPATALYAVAPNNTPSHDQLAKQAQSPGHSTHKTYQVQSSGVFVPARATDSSLKQAAVVLDQVPRTLSEKSVSVQQGAEQAVDAPQHCSVLRKTQPVIENGGYSVTKQKDTPTSSKTTRQCALCTKEATYLCSGCRRIWYCGKDCQLKAWDEHSEICKS